MKTLTIEHLADYLPYKLTGIAQDGSNDNEIETVIGMQGTELTTNIDYIEIDMFKPILRPLSQLTEPITHNGETFVPLDRIEKELGINPLWWMWENIIANPSKAIRLSYPTVKYLHSLHFDTFNLGADNLCVYMNNDGTLEK